MTLYHGTTVEVRQPRILRSEIGRDFGFAFYTTDIREQAERWAVRRAKILSRKTGNMEKAVVNVYDWDPSPEIRQKVFDDASLDWLELVVNCRSNIDYSHGYDVVIGKIANDNVGETVSFVVQGIMRREDAVERLKFEKINNQIAFCTGRALSDLTFKRCYEVR